jgi:hypothetical protein
MSTHAISVSKKDLPALKKEYQKHKDNMDEVFMFKGHEVLVGYAKHLIEYLETWG